MALKHLVNPMTKVFVPILPYLANVDMKYDGENSIIFDSKICTVMSNSVNICDMVDVPNKKDDVCEPSNNVQNTVEIITTEKVLKSLDENIVIKIFFL